MIKLLAKRGWHWLTLQDRPLLIAVAFSLVIHLLVIVFVTVDHQKSKPHAKPKPEVMDVVLFKQPKKHKQQKNDQAKVIANQVLKGAVKDRHDRRTRMARAPAITPAPRVAPKQPPKQVPPPPKKRPSSKPPLPQPVKHAANPLPTKRLAEKKPQKRKRKQVVKTMPSKPIPLSRLLAPSLPFAQQSPRMERARQRPSMRREANIPINTREVKYAPYAHALVNALEEQWRPGQANYDQHPDQDRRVLMKLSIDRDGSLAGVEVLRRSPIAALNASAVQAIHDASPFRPLPSAWGLDRASFYLTFEVVDDRFIFHGM
ncbi:MAG: energy transducer TonB [Mariprofundales bacterium]